MNLYYYEELNLNGSLVSKYILKYSISIYLLFSVYIQSQKFDINKKSIEEKRV